MNFSDYKKARLGGKYIKRVKLPNTDIEMGLVVLTTQQLLEGESAKTEYLKTHGLTESENAAIVENNVQVIYRSAVVADNSEKSFFQDVMEARQLIAEDLNYLSEQYVLLTQEVNPILMALTEADIEDVKKKLESGGVPTGLSYMQLLQALMVLGGYKSTSNSEQDLSSEQK